jgi:hypothetical protein
MSLRTPWVPYPQIADHCVTNCRRVYVGGVEGVKTHAHYPDDSATPISKKKNSMV